MKKLFIALLISQACYAQVEYPQDYFRSPLDIQLVLSGTFGELRSNHFHSGMDIKTQQTQGLRVYTAAHGYVSRIKISHYGYGKALYVTHPNGYTTVYAHLKRFNDKIEAYIKKRQYEKESFEIELFPKPSELLVGADEIIAFSGNTGGSAGPHLHFEIRDNQERPINPMYFGLTVKDTKPPSVLGVYAYPIGDSSHINQKSVKTELRLIPEGHGDFSVEKIDAYGEIGFGVISHDRQDMASNKNGVSKLESFYNGNRNFEMDFRRFSFDETKHINRFIDFEVYKRNKKRIQKLFVEDNNPLSMYSNVDQRGIIKVEDSTSTIYKIRISDFNRNDSWITIPINGKPSDSIVTKLQPSEKHYLYAAQTNYLEGKNFSVSIPSNSLYEDTFIEFEEHNDTLFFHKDVIPMQKSFTINYNLNHYKSEDKSNLFIAKLYGYYQRMSYVRTTRKGDTLTARTKSLGNFVIGKDDTAPVIKPINFNDGKWLSKYRYLKVKISDDLSGISNYRATVNGEWILMEYDYKTGLLIHDFNDNKISETKNNLKIIVTDNVGNSSTFEASFFRK
ncbi:MAG: peptidase M23 [Bacteroidetes bacterium MedPE-SWsnd-G2]|mgnify:CR=1 FL=1|nr:MAG: peptidase M23 [Bacteroidetes bacterium MedPE-SWsnd-G2]